MSGILWYDISLGNMDNVAIIKKITQVANTYLYKLQANMVE